MSEKNKSLPKRLLALGLAAGLCVGSLTGCGGTSSEVTLPADSSAGTETVSAEKKAHSNQETDKAETVYAKADASGNVREVTVETVLKSGGGGTLKDRSSLTDVKNTEGSETFEEKNGVLYWEDAGSDISYKGTSGDDLPVEVAISYKLDGKTVSPEELAGKSGALTVRFDYTNRESRTVEVGDEEYTVQVPFLAMTLLMLDGEKCSNIEVTNGETMDMDGETVVVGYAFPGLADGLKLADYEPTEDIEVPEYVELTADVEDFELEFSATIVTNGLLKELDEDELDDADDLTDSMKELTDASSELVDGTAELLEGMETYEGYLGEYLSGVDALETGTAALNEGMQTLSDNAGALTDGAAALESGLKALEEALSADGDLSELLSDEYLAAILTALRAQSASLSSALQTAQNALSTVESYATEVATYTAAVQSAAQTAKTALEAIDSANLTGTAQQQAEAALNAALADTSLTEAQKQAIVSQVKKNIDLSSASETAQQQKAAAVAALEQLTNLTAPTAPDTSALNTKEISQSIAALQSTLSSLNGVLSGTEDLDGLLEQLQAVLNGLSGDSDQLTEAASSLTDTLAQFDTLVTQVQTGVGQLSDGSSQLTDGISAFGEGLEQLSEGTSQLSDGTSQLSGAGSALSSGFSALTEGTAALADGFAAFDEEGIQELGKLTGDDLAETLNRLRALKQADEDYDNFAGLSEGMTGSVKFIIETDEIQAD